MRIRQNRTIPGATPRAGRRTVRRSCSFSRAPKSTEAPRPRQDRSSTAQPPATHHSVLRKPALAMDENEVVDQEADRLDLLLGDRLIAVEQCHMRLKVDTGPQTVFRHGGAELSMKRSETISLTQQNQRPPAWPAFE